MKIIIPSLIVACFIGILIAVFGFGSSDIATCGNQICEDVIKDPENIELVFMDEGRITRIIDGDTLYIDDTSIRLSLVDTPERGERGYQEAIDLVESVCPIGSNAKFVEDTWQSPDKYQRLVGLVYCDDYDISLNELLLLNTNAEIISYYCGQSEFNQEDWARDFGCKPPYYYP